MNNQEVQLTPCPECGGPRFLFPIDRESINIWFGFFKAARLYACTCLSCGATTMRPSPKNMESLRQWAKTQKPFDLI